MDQTAPATKADITLLKTDMVLLKADMIQWKDDIKTHFDIVIENLRHDMIGTHKDKISVIDDRTIDHEKRIRRLETGTRF